MNNDPEDLQRLVDVAKIAELHRSVEFQIFRHIQNISDSYYILTNSQTGFSPEESKNALPALRTAVHDLYKYMIGELAQHNIREDHIKSVNHRVMPGLTSHYINMMTYAQRFMHSPPPSEETNWKDFKLMNLTALCRIVSDFRYAADAAKIEEFIVDPYSVF